VFCDSIPSVGTVVIRCVRSDGVVIQYMYPLSDFLPFDFLFSTFTFFHFISHFLILPSLYLFIFSFSCDTPLTPLFCSFASISVTIRLGMWQMRNPAMHDLPIRRQQSGWVAYIL
jgi:hypothetical protein